jgi:preprotein translocase subunit SecE
LKQEDASSMATTQVETVSTGADKAKVGAAVALVIVALAAFYLLGRQGQLAQWGALIVGLIAAVAVFLTSEPGKEFIAFGRDSVKEVKKVVWPTRKESIQMTAYVFGFVVIMAVFLWLTDKTLEWTFYDLILGWKK